MVRLSIDFNTHSQNFCDYMTRIASVDLRYDVSYFQSFKKFSYKHLWTIKDALDDSASWTVGLDYGGVKDGVSQGFIEFNPNKCMQSPLFIEFFEVIRANSPIRELVRYDMAIDIPFLLSALKYPSLQSNMYHLKYLFSVSLYRGYKEQYWQPTDLFDPHLF